ncbi:uncharacterized protein [Clytia hemisphaerica]
MNLSDVINTNSHDLTQKSSSYPYTSNKELTDSTDNNINEDQPMYDVKGESRDACDIHQHQFIGDQYYRDGIEVHQTPTLSDDCSYSDINGKNEQRTTAFNLKFSPKVSYCKPEKSSHIEDDNVSIKDHSKTIDSNTHDQNENLPKQTCESRNSSIETPQDSGDTLKNLKMITFNLKISKDDQDSVVLPDYIRKSPDPQNRPAISYKVSGENFHEELFVLYDSRELNNNVSSNECHASGGNNGSGDLPKDSENHQGTEPSRKDEETDKHSACGDSESQHDESPKGSFKNVDSLLETIQNRKTTFEGDPQDNVDGLQEHSLSNNGRFSGDFVVAVSDLDIASDEGISSNNKNKTNSHPLDVENSSKNIHPHEGVERENLPFEDCTFCFLQTLSESEMGGFTCLNEIDGKENRGQTGSVKNKTFTSDIDLSESDHSSSSKFTDSESLLRTLNAQIENLNTAQKTLQNVENTKRDIDEFTKLCRESLSKMNKTTEENPSERISKVEEDSSNTDGIVISKMDKQQQTVQQGNAETEIDQSISNQANNIDSTSKDSNSEAEDKNFQLRNNQFELNQNDPQYGRKIDFISKDIITEEMETKASSTLIPASNESLPSMYRDGDLLGREDFENQFGNTEPYPEFNTTNPEENLKAKNPFQKSSSFDVLSSETDNPTDLLNLRKSNSLDLLNTDKSSSLDLFSKEDAFDSTYDSLKNNPFQKDMFDKYLEQFDPSVITNNGVTMNDEDTNDDLDDMTFSHGDGLDDDCLEMLPDDSQYEPIIENFGNDLSIPEEIEDFNTKNHVVNVEEAGGINEDSSVDQGETAEDEIFNHQSNNVNHVGNAEEADGINIFGNGDSSVKQGRETAKDENSNQEERARDETFNRRSKNEDRAGILRETRGMNIYGDKYSTIRSIGPSGNQGMPNNTKADKNQQDIFGMNDEYSFTKTTTDHNHLRLDLKSPHSLTEDFPTPKYDSSISPNTECSKAIVTSTVTDCISEKLFIDQDENSLNIFHTTCSESVATVSSRPADDYIIPPNIITNPSHLYPKMGQNSSKQIDDSVNSSNIITSKHGSNTLLASSILGNNQPLQNPNSEDSKPDLQVSTNHRTDLQISNNHREDLQISTNHRADLQESTNHKTDLQESTNHNADLQESTSHKADLQVFTNHRADLQISTNHKSFNDKVDITNERLQNAFRYMDRYFKEKGIQHKLLNPEIRIEESAADTQTPDSSHRPSLVKSTKTAFNTITKINESLTKTNPFEDQSDSSNEANTNKNLKYDAFEIDITSRLQHSSKEVSGNNYRRLNFDTRKNRDTFDDIADVASVPNHGKPDESSDKAIEENRCTRSVTNNKFDQQMINATTYKDYGTPLIIDNGSGMIKIGLANKESPNYIPNIVGTENYQKVMGGSTEDPSSNERMVGWKADQYRGILKLRYPMQNGVIDDWDAMIDVWTYSIEEQLEINCSDHPILITENVLSPKHHRERMMEIMMETFEIPAYYSTQQGVMTLYSAGRVSGIVLDSGDTLSQIVPVYEGYGIKHATEAIQIGGRDVTDYLRKLITRKGRSMPTSAEFEIVKKMKEECCFVKNREEDEMKNNLSEFQLPDGNQVWLSEERFQAPELLFQPSLIGKEQPGFHMFLEKSVQKCEIDLRSGLYENIILAGGNSMIPGIHERMMTELKALVRPKTSRTIRIHENKHGIDSVWKGASVLSSLSTFESMLITREEYFEYGNKIVHMKCFS